MENKFSIENLRLYVILDLDYCKDKDLFDITQDIIEGGARTLQLRAKLKSDRKLFSICKRLREITWKKKTYFIINDRADLCLAVGADGVHLGQQDLPVPEVRNIVGRNKLVGISTHSIEEIYAALNLEIDYISIGPIFKSPTKPDVFPLGTEILDKIAPDINKPLIAIGGINKDNVNKLYGKNLAGIAVISGILSKNNIKLATKELISKVDKMIS